jgi:hypothetical protein
MNDNLDRGDPGYPSVKNVKGSEIPASQPEENVISTAENPE